MSDGDELEEIRREKLEELQDDGGADETAAAGTPDEPVYLGSSDDSYQSFVGSHDVVLVDFHADWCGPCKMIEPIVEELAGSTDAAVLKVDIDAHQQLAAEMGVRGVPTLYLYAGGEAVEQLVGVQDGETLRSLIEQHT